MTLNLTRRDGLVLAAASLAAATPSSAFATHTAPLTAAPLTAAPLTAAPLTAGPRTAGPLTAAYDFLSAMMDLYAQGTTLRVAQSFVSIPGEDFADHAFTYDNAVVILAYLQRGNADDISRAALLGASLAYAQSNDRLADGRLRNSYHAKGFIGRAGVVNFAERGTACGDIAWAGLAFCKLYVKTGTAAFLAAAVALGNWIESNLRDTRGSGGYMGGFTNGLVLETHKGTENNIDVAACFAMLAQLDTSAPWATRSAYAQAFVESMWNAQAGFYWVGTGNDGVTINQSFIPEDVQSWSYLATLDPQRDASLDWAVTNLTRKDHGFTGQCFSNTDHAGVWFEGTAHMAAALALRQGPGDAARARSYLASIERAQASGPNANGQGIIAASRRLSTDGGFYYPALHTGATGWYCLADQTGNPFRL